MGLVALTRFERTVCGTLAGRNSQSTHVNVLTRKGRAERRRLIAWVVFAAAAAATHASGQARPPIVAIEFRLIDDSLGVALSSTASIRIDSATIRPTPADTSSRYRLLVPLRNGSHRLTVRMIGYNARSIEFQVSGDSLVTLGTIGLRQSQLLITADPIPWCERVRIRPATLRAGSWLVPAPDSAGQKTWILCSLERPP